MVGLCRPNNLLNCVIWAEKSVWIALSLKLIKTQGISGQVPRLLPAARKLLMFLCMVDMLLDALTDASVDALLMLFANGNQSAATALTQRLSPRVLAHAYRLWRPQRGRRRHAIRGCSAVENGARLAPRRGQGHYLAVPRGGQFLYRSYAQT